MSLGHEHGLVLIGLAGPMDVVNLSLSLSLAIQLVECLLHLHNDTCNQSTDDLSQNETGSIARSCKSVTSNV